jgi:hypothetical protein
MHLVQIVLIKTNLKLKKRASFKDIKKIMIQARTYFQKGCRQLVKELLNLRKLQRSWLIELKNIGKKNMKKIIIALKPK